MNLNEIPAWSDIESQPWFAELTPEEKQQSLTKWQGDMMQFAKDPKEKFAVAATSKAKARSFFGEEMPDDPIADALQRRQKDLEDIGSRYDAFSKGELEEDDEEVLTLNDTLKGNTPYSVIKGRLFVSPQLVWDKAAYEKVVNEAPVDEDERVLAMSAYDGSKERAAEGVVNSLGYTDEEFRDFAAKGFKEGKSNAAILDEWKANNKLPDGILGSLRGVGRQAYFGLRSGLSGLERAMGGLGGFFGSESAQKYAEESGKEAQSYMQRTLGEGPEFIGELTSGAVSIIPTIAAGAAASFFTEGAALPAAASITAGAIQSAGATQAETYEFYRNQGLDHANALAESRMDGLVSGLITGAITHYAGKLGDKIGLGKGIEGLFSGPASKIASKLTQREISESLKAGAKAVGGSFLQEGSEELLDQAAQDAYSMIKRDPTLTLAEAINNALQAGKVGAVLGGAAEAGKLGLNSLLNSAKFSVAETPLEEELQSFFEIKQTAADAVVDNPNVQNYVNALGTAKSVVDENLVANNRLTADVLNEEVNEGAEDLKDNIKTDVVKVAADIAPIVNEAPSREEVIQNRLSEIESQLGPRDTVVLGKDGKPETKPYRIATTEEKALLDELAAIEGEAPAEAPAISPKPPVSPAVETAPIGETQPPQGKPVETPANAAPEITLEESLRQEPQDRVEVGTPEETGVGDSVQRAAEGEKEVAPQRILTAQEEFLASKGVTDTNKLPQRRRQALEKEYQKWLKERGGAFRITLPVQRGGGNLILSDWKQAYPLLPEDLKTDLLRAVVNNRGRTATEQDVADVMAFAEELVSQRPADERILNESNLFYDISANRSATPEIKARAQRRYEEAQGLQPSPPTTGAVPTETLPDGQKVTPGGVASPGVEQKVKNKRDWRWTFESWNERFPDEPRTQEEIDAINAENTAWNADVDAILASFGEAPAEAPAISPKPPVSPAVGTAPIGETQEQSANRIKKQMVRFASGMSAIGDLRKGSYARAGHKNYGIGFDVGLLSKNAINELADFIINLRTQVFIDSGAFSNFKKSVNVKPGDKEIAPLDFDQILAKYDAIISAIQQKNEVEETDYPRPMLVMPDVIGNQAESLSLIEKYKNWIAVEAAQNTSVPIVPIPLGELTLSQAYNKILDTLNSNTLGIKIDPRKLVVGVPSNAKAISRDDLAQFLSESKPPRIHFLGAAADKNLNPLIEAVSQNSPTTQVTADASKVRSAILNGVSKGKSRSQAIFDALYQEDDPLVVLDSIRKEPTQTTQAAAKTQTPESEAVDAYGIKLPEGYVKQGELYVYEKTQPLPKGDAAGERGAVAPAPAVEPAPEARPVSPQVQAFRDAVSQMSPTAQAKWTPELRATAEAYLDSGGTTGLQGLSDVQQKVVGRFLPEEVKAAFDAEDARKRAQRNKLPDHRESSLPPTPGKQIRKIGKGAMESVPVVLDEIAKVIPNIRDLVEVRESVDGEPDAEGFYDPQADKAVVLVNNVYLKPQHGGSQEAALRETIIHELLHRGFAKLRQTNPQLFEQFEAFSLADTNDAQFEALVRRGYSMYSNWKDDPAQNQKAREEIFIRKAVVDLNFKGIEALKSPTSLASQFFSWLRGLLNKLLGRKVDDETLLHWSRVFLNAAQADFIEKTPGERVSPDIRYSLGEPPDMQAEADALREVTPSSQALDKFRETFGTPRQDVGQVLGKKEGSVYTQAQVAPLSQHARNVIGFEVNEEGDPVVNPKATQKALDLVSKLLNTKGYASRFNTQAAKLFEGTPVDPEIASAVLVQELQAYANRLSASSPKAEDQILKAALTPFYNTVILGNYLTLRTAGRALQAAGRASNMDDARKSREEAEKAVDKEITKQLGDEALPAAEGMDKAGVEGGVDAIKDDIPAPADPTLRLLDLAVESLDEVAKAKTERVFDILFEIGQLEELVAQDEKVGNKAMSILRNPNLAARNYPTDPAERKALLAQKKAELATALDEALASLQGAKPETKKKVKERATKAGGKAKTAPKVSDKEEDPITKEINALAAELGTLSKLDQAGLDVVKQIAKKLVAKFQPAKLDALKDKVEAVVYKYVQNAERLELAEFSEKMTADLDAIGLKKPELQEALVAKAWAYHFAAPTKAVQALTAKMKSAERADRGGPESVANVRKAINGAVNSTEENRDAFVTRLTDQLVALGVEAQTAEAAAKAAFEYRAKQADKKIERVMETLRLGKRRALLKSFQNTKEADRTEEWQRATLKAAFVEAGLTNKQAEKGADKAMQEAEAIFATAEMKVAEIKQRSVQKFLDSLASVEDETPVTKTKQDNLRSVFKDATLDEEFNEAVLMDRFQTLGATEAQAKALVEKVAEVREDKAEALAEAKRKQVNKVIDATYKRIAQLESGTPSEKAKKQESLRNAVGAAIKAKEFDEAAFRASVASFGASEPQVETLVQNVKKLRQLGESKPLSKAKLRQFLLSFPKNVLANPEQREALLRSFLKGKEYSEAEINRIVPQVLRDFDTGYQKARKAYLDELEKKLKPKQGQKESKQDQQNRKMLNALRSGLADTTSEASVALAKSLGFEAFRPQDDHILSKLDEEMRKLREQGRLSDSNAKFDAIKSLLIRRRPPRGFGEVVAQSWITSALSSLSNLAVNVWAPMGEAGVRLMSDIVRATALRKFDEIPLYFEAAGKAMKGTLSRFNFAVKTDTFTNSVNTLIAGMASMKDEMQRSAAVLKDKNASPAAKVNARFRYVMSFGDYSRRILSSIDDTWYTALSSYVGSSNLIKLLGDAKMPKKAVEAIVFHANNDALNQARAEYETLQAVEQFIEAMRGKTNEEIDAGFEYLGLNDASVTKEQANYIQELVSAFQSLRLRSGATGDELIKRALKELRNFRASVSVRATELGQMRTKELVREALSDTQTPAQVEEAIKEFDENAKKAASFGMGLHRVEGVPPYDILGNMFGIVDAMGRQAVQKSPLLGRMIVGFFGIPLNLLNRAVWFTPYGLGRYFLAKWQMAKNPEEKFYEYSMASQRERTMRFTEAAVGTSMTMLLYALGVARDSDDKEDEGFYITLGGPSNKTEYDAWYARGFRKFSICYKTKSGSVVSVPYGRGTGEVLKGPLMLLGAFDDMRLNKKLGDREDMSSVIEYLNAAAAGIGKQATFLGAKNTAGAFFSEQFGTSTASNLAYSAANLIPFNGLDRSISALALGPPDRSRTGAIWANIPIVRHLAHQPAINVFGDPWGNKSESALNQLWDRQWNLGLLPLNISAPLMGNQKRLYNFIGERLMGPSDPLRGALELRNGYLTDEEFYRYKQYRGKQMAQTWLTDLDRWRKLDDDSLSKAIAELSTKATKKAKDRFNYK